MKRYSASTTISAPAERIWAILTDAPAYPSWDPSVDRIEGTIAPGSKLKAFTKLSPGRAFPVTVSTFEPARRMVWSGGMPLGLFTGVRTFTLTPRDSGPVEVGVVEEFGGPLLPLFGRSIPDMDPVFRDFLAGLKARAEGE